MSVDTDKTAWSTAKVVAALREKFSLPAFAIFFEVANATGWGKSRSADAIAMSCWPSRGLYLYGFEIKVSRSDWVKERDNPAKAEAICKYMDFWYVVTGKPGIVATGELPPTWGLIEPKGGKLTITKEATPLEPKPINREFLAPLLRRACEDAGCRVVDEALKKQAIDEAVKAHRDYTITSLENEVRRYRDLFENRDAIIKNFEVISGINMDRWGDGKKHAEAVRLVLKSGLNGQIAAMQRLGESAQRIVSVAKEWEATARESEEANHEGSVSDGCATDTAIITRGRD